MGFCICSFTGWNVWALWIWRLCFIRYQWFFFNPVGWNRLVVFILCGLFLLEVCFLWQVLRYPLHTPDIGFIWVHSRRKRLFHRVVHPDPIKRIRYWQWFKASMTLPCFLHFLSLPCMRTSLSNGVGGSSFVCRLYSVEMARRFLRYSSSRCWAAANHSEWSL